MAVTPKPKRLRSALGPEALAGPSANRQLTRIRMAAVDLEELKLPPVPWQNPNLTEEVSEDLEALRPVHMLRRIRTEVAVCYREILLTFINDQ